MQGTQAAKLLLLLAVAVLLLGGSRAANQDPWQVGKKHREAARQPAGHQTPAAAAGPAATYPANCHLTVTSCLPVLRARTCQNPQLGFFVFTAMLFFMCRCWACGDQLQRAKSPEPSEGWCCT